MEPATGEFCIGLGEPAFLAAIGAGTTAAAGLGACLARLDRWLTMGHHLRNAIWCVALAASVGGSLLLLNVLFTLRYPHLELCTTVVGPWFAVPGVALFAGGVAAQLFSPPKQ